MSVLVECANLTKRYPGQVEAAVDHMSFTIESGKIIGLLGPNGSGKTTIIKMMNGLLKPTEGVVVIDGYEPGIETKKVVSYLPERTYLEAQRTVADLITFFEDFYEDFDRSKAMSMLETLDIKLSSRLKTLSKGTKEKIQLILVMSRSAKLYILDEPIAGVDPAARDYIIRTIINNYNPEASVLICTHLITDIENILDEVIFIKKGQLVLQSGVDDIREQHGKTVDAYFREVFAC